MILLVWRYHSSLDGELHDELLLDSMEEAQEFAADFVNDFPNGRRVDEEYGIIEEWQGVEFYSIQRIA